MPDITKAFKIWLPQVKDKIYEDVKIIDSDNVTWDLDEDLVSFNITWPTMKDGLAYFTLRINNNERKYMSKFVTGNKISFYFDYTDGTTLYKTFYIESPLYGYDKGGYYVELKGRDYPQTADMVITQDYSDGVSALAIFNGIVNNNFSSILNTGGVAAGMVEQVYAIYESKPPISVLGDVLNRVDYDGRIEADGTITTFVDTGVLSTTESCIVGQNVTSISGFGVDSAKEKNRVQVIGGVKEGCQFMKMEQDTTRQSATWIRDGIIKNTDIKSIADAQERADVELAFQKSLPDQGTITSIGMATMKPGQLVMCSIPDCKIVGDYYVKSVNHKFSSKGWETTIELNIQKTRQSTFIEDEAKKRVGQRNLDNPNDMKDTLIFFDFRNEDNIDSLSNVQVYRNKLRLVAGQSTGVMISDEFVADDNFTEYEIRGVGTDDMSVSTFFMCNDGGFSYKESNFSEFNAVLSLTSTGNRARLKVQLTSDGDNPVPELSSVGVYIKR